MVQGMGYYLEPNHWLQAHWWENYVQNHPFAALFKWDNDIELLDR